MERDNVKARKEWIARQTAQQDQREARHERMYDLFTPDHNFQHLIDNEARRFWIGLHRWELDQLIETGSVDDYPQKSEND